VPVATFTWNDLPDTALAVFLVVVGIGLAYTFLQLGATLHSLSALVRGTEREVLPVINKVGGTVDRVNAQLDKVDQITDSAVDAVDSVDTAIRSVSTAVTRPVQIASGLAAGLTHGVSSFKAHRDWRGAVEAGKAAAARREAQLAEELRHGGEGTRDGG
jgi:uncharacterized protein YoxC